MNTPCFPKFQGCKMCIRIQSSGAREVDLVPNSFYYSFRRPQVGSQHLHGGLQTSIIPDPGRLMPSDFRDHQAGT